jgi:hypothetical protein
VTIATLRLIVSSQPSRRSLSPLQNLSNPAFIMTESIGFHADVSADTFPFLRLPMEVQQNIFDDLRSDEEARTAFLQTPKAIYNSFAPSFYASASYTLDAPEDFFNDFLPDMPSLTLRYIREISINVDDGLWHDKDPCVDMGRRCLTVLNMIKTMGDAQLPALEVVGFEFLVCDWTDYIDGAPLSQRDRAAIERYVQARHLGESLEAFTTWWNFVFAEGEDGRLALHTLLQDGSEVLLGWEIERSLRFEQQTEADIQNNKPWGWQLPTYLEENSKVSTDFSRVRFYTATIAFVKTSDTTST